jgi:hypothetical protein
MKLPDADQIKLELEETKLLLQEERGSVAAWKQIAAKMRDALEEVAHHADDECGFMDAVRSALDQTENVDFGHWVDAGYTNAHGSTVMRRITESK